MSAQRSGEATDIAWNIGGPSLVTSELKVERDENFWMTPLKRSQTQTRLFTTFINLGVEGGKTGIWPEMRSDAFTFLKIPWNISILSRGEHAVDNRTWERAG